MLGCSGRVSGDKTRMQRAKFDCVVLFRPWGYIPGLPTMKVSGIFALCVWFFPLCLWMQVVTAGFSKHSGQSGKKRGQRGQFTNCLIVHYNFKPSNMTEVWRAGPTIVLSAFLNLSPSSSTARKLTRCLARPEKDQSE